MLEKISSINIAEFKTFLSMQPQTSRVFLPDAETVILIENDEEEYTLNFFTKEKLEKQIKIDYSYGQLYNIEVLAGSVWLEFRAPVVEFEEEYNLLRLTSDSYVHVGNIRRDSYNHEHTYHSLFEKDGSVYLNFIRHNRVHQYQVGADLSEYDFIEGGKWFLCGKYSICSVGDVIELYNENFEMCNAFEYDYGIDFYEFSYSPAQKTLAVALTDIKHEQSAIFSFQEDSGIINMTFIENPVSDILLSFDRIVVNPFGFDPGHDLGGVMVFNNYAYLMYSHLKSKASGTNSVIGAFPLPFHRSYGMVQMPSGFTLVMDSSVAVLLDYNFRVNQEIKIYSGSDYANVYKPTGKTAVLKIKEDVNGTDGFLVYKDIKLNIYEWQDQTDGKIIELQNFSNQ